MHQEIPKVYNQQSEPDIYRLWELSGYFNPDNLEGKPFTIIMPPPNANASLHLGHALFLTLEDIMIRFERMRGRKTLWLPGMDHAGFETQVVFEKQLEKEGRSRFKMSREEFYKETLSFVEENKKNTEAGIKRIGASADWSRNIFTLDPRIVKIVYETFEEMHRDGLVYKGNRICNWCPKHQTGLADLETKYEERAEPFYYFKYGPFTIGTSRPETKFGDKYVVMHPKDKRYSQYQPGQKIQVEWINGPVTATVVKDEAVDMKFGTGVMTITPAHDPVDFEIAQRHNLDFEQIIDQRGKLLPIAQEFSGMKIMEARPKIVEKLQSKGLLEKIDETYKHNVQLCYKCSNLIEPQVIPQWYVAMTKPVKNGKSLRDMAVDAVKSKKVKINPKRFEKVYLHWMKNIVDWPISRQIWWGIPIPVWYCGGQEKANLKKMGVHETLVNEWLKGKTRTYRLRDHGLKLGEKIAFENSASKTLIGYGIITGIQKTTVGDIELPDIAHSGKYKATPELIAAFQRMHPEKNDIGPTAPAWIYDFEFDPISKDCGQIVISDEKPGNCPACNSSNLVQDPDTFDTWFSSGQWPYASLMASSKKDFQTFYPTQVMETGWDILFFWVARMIMFGLYKTGHVPFEYVYLHGLIRAGDKQKMSKSKGNVLWLSETLDKYGSDAVRMSVVVGNLPGVDAAVSEDKIRGYRNFANKIWNASRFVLQNTEDISVSLRGAEATKQSRDRDRHASLAMTLPDQKILKELDTVAADITKLLDQYDFAHAAEKLYHYFWHTFADKIIEEAKPKLADPKKRASAQLMLKEALETQLKLLHPFMPYVTEAVWQLNHNPSRLGGRAQAEDLLMMQSWPKKSK